jgi:Uma2 family endonuclease
MSREGEIMSTVEQEVLPLVAGDKLTRDEFLRRWEAMPNVKFAELIGGVVYMPSPLSRDHSVPDLRVAYWVGHYAAFTPGCEAGSNGTWLMREDSPQPDVYLRLLPEHGGQSATAGPYPQGAPEFLAEICLSSTAHDLHEKFDLYQAAGVREYLAFLVREQEVRWHRLINGVFRVVAADADGVLRSAVFPGLWLDAGALLAGDMAQVFTILTKGLNTPEHGEFVARLTRGGS